MTNLPNNQLLSQPGAIEIAGRLPALSKSVQNNHADAAAWADLGVALRCSGKLAGAIAAYRRSLNIRPDNVSALSNLGGALRANGEFDEAVMRLKEAIEFAPNLAAAHFNLGLALEDSGRLAEALCCYEKALSLEPDRKDAAGQRAFTLLRTGNLPKGFEAYEKRLQFEPRLRRGFAQPSWQGKEFRNQTLLLYSEQGRGDTFQFIRYAKWVKQFGGRVLVECPADLAELVAQASGVDEVVVQGRRLPHFDFHASLMSLPFIAKTSIDTIPSEVPYLCVPKRAYDSKRLSGRNALQVGIVWTSGHEDVGAHNRSTQLIEFLSLAELPHVALYSLQVGPSVADLQLTGAEHFIEDLGSKFRTFSDTADAIRQLDLVISVDTAVVHLAGALAKPVWVLLPYVSEWRWLQYRNDSPWYPTARLYRQSAPFAWSKSFEKIREDLQLLCAR